MPRIRSIKPDFWQDEKLSPLSPLTRLVFLGLISQADDAGRLLDNVKTIDGLLFPMTADSSEQAIEELSTLGRILRYEGPSGQRLIQVTNWDKHQKVKNPAKYNLPGPDGKSSVESTEGLPEKGPAEVGSRKTEVGSRIVDGRGSDPPEEAPNDETAIDSVIRAANRGMIDNPALDDACQPIELGHGSRQHVADWLASGIPPDVAAATCYERAKQYKPTPRRNRITTMAYFSGAVQDEFQKRAARNGSAPAMPQPSPVVTPYERWKQENQGEYAKVRAEKLKEFERYDWWNPDSAACREDLEKSIRKRVGV